MEAVRTAVRRMGERMDRFTYPYVAKEYYLIYNKILYVDASDIFHILYILSKGCTPLISSYDYLEQSNLLFGSQKRQNLFYNIPSNIIAAI